MNVVDLVNFQKIVAIAVTRNSFKSHQPDSNAVNLVRHITTLF